MCIKNLSQFTVALFRDMAGDFEDGLVMKLTDCSANAVTYMGFSVSVESVTTPDAVANTLPEVLQLTLSVHRLWQLPR